ncbi:hypothetical protein KO493_11650 [Tamlana agarivorans]|uniref:Uncharacterized protein n=1 Tax=Pseudotamlana agarivorans TaxID=481183 RepID=A0ACC5UAJ8_9FLAO|nr:hypothetical protein [Tamlana agarivorans]MBU2951352.1 hypothetical protein [Tamlana agarivorans]
MKKYIILLLTLSYSLLSYGQDLKENELFGKWKVLKILEKTSNPNMEPIIKGFENATLIFDTDKNFELTTTTNSELFTMFTSITKNTKWKFESNKQLIHIGNESDGYTIMGIFTNKNDNQILFRIEESEIVLEVEKTN